MGPRPSSGPAAAPPATALPDIPLLDVGVDWPFETLERAFDHVTALLDAGSGRIPMRVVRMADTLSRRWLARWHPSYLGEIDRIAARLGRPGAYFLNVSYEWGCTSSAGPSPDGRSARLMRVLDWPDRGLGRYVIAARVHGEAGLWLTLTWPGYNGVLQAVAPGRFAAALNQAPMAKPVGIYALDWLVNRRSVWGLPHLPATYLLRQVFEGARDFAEAKAMLTATPIALPAIFTLAGLAPDDACIIERQADAAHVIAGAACAANAWQAPRWSGRPRGQENALRLARMREALSAESGTFDWLQPPILNPLTRLVFVADADSGSVVAQGFEADGPATAVLRCNARPDAPRPGGSDAATVGA